MNTSSTAVQALRLTTSSGISRRGVGEEGDRLDRPNAFRAVEGYESSGLNFIEFARPVRTPDFHLGGLGEATRETQRVRVVVRADLRRFRVDLERASAPPSLPDHNITFRWHTHTYRSYHTKKRADPVLPRSAELLHERFVNDEASTSCRMRYTPRPARSVCSASIQSSNSSPAPPARARYR